jgi:hypothetical protein
MLLSLSQVVIDAFRMINPPGGMMGMTMQPTDPRQTTSNIGEHVEGHCISSSSLNVLVFFLMLL